MTTPQPNADRELRERVVYEFLRAGAALGLSFSLSLKDVGRLLQMACFHELRASGRQLDTIGRLLGISRRKTAQMSKQLKRAFLPPERHHTLPRRIEFVLWAAPLSVAKIRQALPDTNEEAIRDALTQLIADGRVVERTGRVVVYERRTPKMRLVRDDWMSRIDALGHLVMSAGDVAHARFFAGDDEPAFARTVSMHVRPDDVAELNKLYEEIIWPRLVELDEAAEAADDALEVDVALHWAPKDHIRTLIRSLSDEEPPS